MRKIGSILIVLLLAFLGYFFASPYLVLNKLKNAADAKDAQSIIAQVDFASVKSSVKEQLKNQMLDEMQGQDDETQMLGAVFASAMLDGVVETMVTPKAVELILDGKDISDKLTAKQGNTQNSTPKDASSNTQENQSEWDFQTSYQSMNRFAVFAKKSDSDKQPVQVILQRDGLFNWKIVDVQLPLDKSENK